MVGIFPGELAELPPGPALGEMLASLDLSRYGSADLFRIVELQAKQVAFDQARLLEAMLEAAYAYGGEVKQEQRKLEPSGSGGDGGGPARWRVLDEFCGDQVAMSLVMSRSYAQGQVLLAQDLMVRLPVVFTALREGRIDRARAEVFSRALGRLDDDTARQIAEREIAKAANRIPTQLQRRLHQQAIKANPDLARERYDKTVTDRGVYLQPYTDGTAILSAINLPPARAAAAFNRIDRMARAAKSAGDVRTLPQLRADATLDLLSGRPFMLSPSLDNLTAEADQAARNLGYSTDEPDDLAGTIPPPKARHRASTRTTTKPTATKSGAAQAGAGGSSSRTDAPSADTNPNDLSYSDSGGEADPDRDEEPDERASQADLDLLATLFPDHDEPHMVPPGKVPVAGDDPRMCVCGGIKPADRRGVTNIEIKLSTLAYLNDHPGIIPGYGPVLADIARQIALEQDQQWRYSVVDEHGNLLHHGITKRRPDAVETAFVRARDKVCIAPGCTRPATVCDLDHVLEWTNHGPSLRHNLSVECRHHHRLRHEHHHRIHRTPHGIPIWQAPNGTHYATMPDGYHALFPITTNEEPPLHLYDDDYPSYEETLHHTPAEYADS